MSGRGELPHGELRHGELPPGAAPPGADPHAELAPAYALGALDADERRAYEAHLAECAECRAEVRAYTETAALLAHAAPAAEPPPALRARILAEARTAGRGTTDAAAPEAPRLVVERGGTAPPRAPASWARRGPWLAAAASLALAAGLGAGWARERAGRTLAVRQAEARVAARYEGARPAGPAGAGLRDMLAARDSTISALNAVVAALAEPDVRTARLAATGEAAAMRLTWNRRRGVVVVTAAALAPPPAGRTYQLWGIAGRGAPQNLGTFRPAPDGTVRAVLRVPLDASMDVAAVTEEPAGGSPRPTGAPLMTGSIGAD